MNLLKSFFNSTNLGFGFSAEDVKSIIIGALLNALGIALVAIIDQLSHLNWGLTGPIVTGLAIVLINLIRKWLPGIK